ncbi:FeoA family protein [Crocosphaera sp. Alani8]|uniref:FeoA family protein n=1 Tax=Crocosphaera sp. Alani8 TaxID=3038952 RepID=UPI00313D7A56
MTLKELKKGKMARVQEVLTDNTDIGNGFKTRLEAMGIVPGKPVQVLRSAWLGGPLGVRVGSTTEIAIRRSEAELVIVEASL